MTSIEGRYRGRFAPSPTGPLHLGSLLTAVASFVDARAAGGEWLVRIEDIDPPREIAGASEQILESLRAHGLQWDGEVLFQSTRRAAYLASLDVLKSQGLLFDCICTRATLGPDGNCGGRCIPVAGEPCAQRLKISRKLPTVLDQLQETVGASNVDVDVLDERRSEQRSESSSPQDIVLWRKDDLPSYQLAVSVDDIWQGITTVVRGADLLSHTALQVHLMRLLGAQPPRYAHLPILCADDGRKLSKQNGATALQDSRAMDNLRLVLRLLQQPSAGLQAANPEELLQRAADHWKLGSIRHLGDQLHSTAGRYVETRDRNPLAS